MAENRKGTEDGLYYLNRSQLTIFVTGFTLATAVIFFLGILIGQRIEERKLLKKDEPVVKIPVEPSPPAVGSAPKEELTFYDTLTKAPAKAQPSGNDKPTKEAQPETKPVAKESKPAADPAKSPAAAKVKQPETKTAVKEVKIVTKGETQSGKNVKERLEKITPQKTAAGALKTEKGKDGGWAVQVNAFPNERDAKGLVKKLLDKGYDAYTVPANIKEKTWYRVRVGHLATRDEARTLQENLRKKENYVNAIAVSR